LAGPVVAEDAEPVALAHVQVHAVQRPDLDERVHRAAEHPVDQELLQRHPALLPDAEVQRHVGQVDGCHWPLALGMSNDQVPARTLRNEPTAWGSSSVIRNSSLVMANQRWKIRRFWARAPMNIASPAKAAMMPTACP